MFVCDCFCFFKDLFEPQTALLRYVLEQPYSRDMVCNMLGLNKQVLYYAVTCDLILHRICTILFLFSLLQLTKQNSLGPESDFFFFMRSYQVNWTLLFLSFVYCFTNVKLKSRDLKYDFFFCIAFFSYKASLKNTFDRQQETPSSNNKNGYCSCNQFLKHCCSLLHWHVIVVEQ